MSRSGLRGHEETKGGSGGAPQQLTPLQARQARQAQKARPQKTKRPGAPEATFDDDDDAPAKQNWRKMPMEAISRGSLAMVRGAVDACSVSGKEPGVMRLITIGFSPYCEKVRVL